MGAAPQVDYGKPDDGMRRHTTSLEPATMDLGAERTPVDRFFVCSGSDAPRQSIDGWKLTIGGDAAASEMTIDWDMLQSLPQRELGAWLECAGNGRQMFALAGGHPVSPEVIDTPWTLGGMGMAQWTGVALRDVLDLAGVSPDAAWIGAVGADHDNVEGEPAAMCLPLAKALDVDTIIAVSMNDEPLVAAHGHPARLIVPGWVAAYSIKWLSKLVISASWVPSWRADVYYRLRTPTGDDLGPATAHPVKSCLALDWPATMAPGPSELRGYARCGTSEIDRVEFSVDGGPWAEAKPTRSLGRWGWQPFTCAWVAEPGEHEIRTRAWNRAGETQPDTNDAHPNTILWNAVTRHPIVVSAVGR